MSPAGAELHGFAYGEHLDELSQRSLGYRLLAPPEPHPWCAEVEALARHLQAAPYPDHWPPSELFCSVLLATGERLLAVARYGLADHTTTQRRGGLELIGVVGPASLDVAACRSIYQWLKKRRAGADDLHALGGRVSLAEAAAEAPAPLPPADPTPVLPVRLWQGGALLFAATTPSDPDHRLNLLEQGAGGAWQWLPLVGADFPVATYAGRGPLVAWTPHLAGVALKLDAKPQAVPAAPVSRRRLGGVVALLFLLLALLVGLNLWATLSLGRQLSLANQSDRQEVHPTAPEPKVPPTTPADPDSRRRFARALYDLLAERGASWELNHDKARLLAEYERAAREHKELRLDDADTDGKLAVGATSLLAGRGADHVEDLVKKALSDKGFHPNLVRTACELVHEQLTAESRDGR
jgi:hypothetical protein